MPDHKSKTQQRSEVQSLITGMPTYCTTMSFTYGGKTYTSAAVVTVFQDLESASQATIAAKAAYHEAVIKENALLEADGPLLLAVRQTLALSFASQPTVSTALGVTPHKKPAPLTSEQLAARAAKARATREARGTASKQQKATIVGNVSGVTITPITAPPVAPATTPPAASPVVPSGTAGGTTAHG